MHRAIVFCLILALPPHAVADISAPRPAMSAAAFDAYSRGKTLYYVTQGTPYGAETYLPGRRVIWAFLGQPCRYGLWYQDAGGHICFVYDGDPGGPQCWNFYRRKSGLAAQFIGPPSHIALVEVYQSDRPLSCPDPGARV